MTSAGALPWQPSGAGISLALRVTPRGGRDGIDGIGTLSDGRHILKLRVRAVADKGAANRAVTDVLAKLLGVPKSSVRLVSGASSREKLVAIDGDPTALCELLQALTQHQPALKGST